MTNIVTKINEKKFVGVEEAVKDKLTQLAGKKLVSMQEAVCNRKMAEAEDEKDAECGCDEDELENSDTDNKKDDVEESTKKGRGNAELYKTLSGRKNIPVNPKHYMVTIDDKGGAYAVPQNTSNVKPGKGFKHVSSGHKSRADAIAAAKELGIK